ncbi:hypothetical protein OS493_018113 [Desmophyllum pertusum]|uniref:Uncharacterized protein n=1 Tax=Desmophyllum pertusum TaxID=174260 RepID=A0A9X0CJV9_9CNID|nr:hypothetical protein OS493_018113 [Desmophyllum pertusum]
MSGPDIDVSTGKIKDPKVKLDAPSAELDLPSAKKKRGNCLSCTGGTDKDEPYRKTKGNAEFGFNGPEIDGSTNIANAGEFDIHGSDPDMKFKGRRNQEDFKLSTAAPEVGDLAIPHPSASLPSTSGDVKVLGRNIDINAGGPGLDITAEKPIVGLDANAPDFDKTKGKLQTKFSGPDVDVSTENVTGPKANLHGISADLDVPSKKKPRGNCFSCAGDAEKSEPYGRAKGSTTFDGPDLDGSLEMKNLASVEELLEIDISKKPKIGLKSPGFDVPKAGGSGGIDINGPDLSYEKPEISGPSFDKKGKAGGWGGIDVNEPDLSYEKPKISGPSFGKKGRGIDIQGPHLDIDTPQGREDFDISKPGISVPSGGDLDVDANLPDMDISRSKPRFGLDTNGLDMNIPGVKNDLDVVEPHVSIPSIDKKGKFSPSFPSEDLSFDVNTPDADVFTRKPTFGLDMKGLDVDTPDPDFTFPSIDKASGGQDFDTNFDWGINTSTPKGPEANKQLKGLPHSELEFETNPIEGDISVVNTYDNFELHSTPESFPSTAYEEPRSLQRYDEIRPEMEIRLVSPKETNQSDQRFKFDIPDTSLDMAKDSWRPGSMTLVNVEENVTVCSASLEQDKPPSPPNRTLTLDREVRQKIEVVFPEKESSDQPSNLKQKSSSSSSSSSSSDGDGDQEKKPKRKKKFRLPKAFRKSSSSSASSKEDDTPSKKKERKRSASSSSDDEDGNKKKRHSTGDILPVTTKEENKSGTSSSSSSSDEATSVVRKGLPKRKGSKSSSSSSDKENHEGKKKMYKLEHTTFPFVSAEKKEPTESVASINTVQEDLSKVVSRSVKPVDPDLSIVIEKPKYEIKAKERKRSTSSSSDEESKSAMVYNVEYTTCQQQYIVEPEKEQDQPVLSVSDVQEDAPGVVLHSIKPIDSDFSFRPDAQTKPKDHKRSTSSSSSSDEEPSKYPETTNVHDAHTVEYTSLPQTYVVNYDIKESYDPQKQ